MCCCVQEEACVKRPLKRCVLEEKDAMDGASGDLTSDPGLGSGARPGLAQEGNQLQVKGTKAQTLL